MRDELKAWADHLSRAAAVSARERAVAWAPALASISERLARRREEAGEDPLPDLDRARRLDPENAERWMQLGQQAEFQGDLPLAERSLLAAAARSRLYQPRYLLAQFYFRRERDAPFWQWARAALEMCPANCSPVWDLGWRRRPDAGWLARNLLPASQTAGLEFLRFLMDSQLWADAARAAGRLAESVSAGAAAPLLHYCEAGLEHGQARGPWAVWSTLGRRGLVPPPPAPGELLANAGFARPPTGAGFDWHLTPQAGVGVSAEPGQLRVSLSGHQPEQCPLAWQFASLEPGARYRLSWEEHPPREAIARAISAEVWGSARQIAGPGSLSFTATAEAARVLLLYRRPPGSARLEGGVAIARLHLERLP